MRTEIIDASTAAVDIEAATVVAVCDSEGWRLHTPGPVRVTMVNFESYEKPDFVAVKVREIESLIGPLIDRIVVYERLRTERYKDRWWGRYGFVAYLKA